LNGITFLANFIKTFPVGSQVDGRGGRQTDRQDDINSLHFSFRKESRIETEAEVVKRASKMPERTAYFEPKTLRFLKKSRKFYVLSILDNRNTHMPVHVYADPGS
jgi:hypothetical protein